MSRLGKLAFAACALASVAGAPALAQEGASSEVSIASGIEQASGHYGTLASTSILVVPVTARLRTGNWRLSASTAWVRVDGGAIIPTASGGPQVVDPAAPRALREGLGDSLVGIAYVIPEDRLGFELQIGGQVKLPTGSRTKGLGTGKSDLAASLDLSKTIGPVTPFVTAGYRLNGDAPTVRLGNTFFGSVGVSFPVRRATLVASFDYREAASALARDSHEAFAALTIPASSRLDLSLYASAGLSKGAPAHSVGARLTLHAF